MGSEAVSVQILSQAMRPRQAEAAPGVAPGAECIQACQGVGVLNISPPGAGWQQDAAGGFPNCWVCVEGPGMNLLPGP